MDINSIATAKSPQVTSVTESAPAKAQAQSKQPQQQQLRSATPQSESSDNNSDSITITAPIPDKTVQIRDMNELRNATALKVSLTDQKLAAAADVVDKMKGTLEGIIVKNFPPFPAESSDRQKLLMSYISLQKELIQLTLPPPPPAIYEQVKLQWQDLFNNNSPKQSRLPAVTESTSSDSGLNAAIGVLSSFSDGISSIRETVKQTLTGN